MDSHLPSVPSVRTLTARTLSGGDPELLGGHSHGAGDSDAFLDGLSLQFGAEVLESGHVSGSEGDSDSLHLLFALGGGVNVGLDDGFGHDVAEEVQM